ncbi:accessory Sec system glycosylation chaperone GtfB [Staphylococcus delphini]|uniref:accessory Sec system glycosylation chaperone GtfB n=1 Tax=Staphylococcus delphini TaxID=53344 RepID=UPI0012D300CF|nr:accessory Sec system glycosylation chaperone GtfB [Staphylococcus delphini]MTV23693.1 accessory Sec system glycosylation chaperone GtfB [Staphylococcus delphini]
MINLFEFYHASTQLLHDTLEQAGYQNFTICIEDDGFLPQSMTSPYQFFAGNRRYDNDRPKFFNEVDVPPLWEIVGDGQAAKIKDMGQIRGEIIYRPHYKTRIVSQVRWLDQQGRIRTVDHFTQAGFKFAETIYDLTGTAIFKKYFTRTGQEIIYENYVTGNYVLNWQGQTYFFESKIAFIIFYLQQMDLDLSHVVINSLSTPFLVLYHMHLSGRGVLFWQEESQGHVPGNMLTMLNHELERHFTVLIPDQREYKTIVAQLTPQQSAQVQMVGYLYRFHKMNQYEQHVLTLTNSDDIPQLDQIVTAHPELQFHIAARTEMSAKLMAFDQYANVKLYPTANKETFAQLYDLCDIYLDINRGNEIENAVTQAFRYQQLIFAFDETAHHRTFTAPEHIFSVNAIAMLHQMLGDIVVSRRAFEQKRLRQLEHAHHITRDRFVQLMSDAFG